MTCDEWTTQYLALRGLVGAGYTTPGSGKDPTATGNEVGIQPSAPMVSCDGRGHMPEWPNGDMRIQIPPD